MEIMPEGSISHAYSMYASMVRMDIRMPSSVIVLSKSMYEESNSHSTPQRISHAPANIAVTSTLSRPDRRRNCVESA